MASNEDKNRTYEVGYKKPPAHSRFEKGVSGNPYGRPRKTDRDPFKSNPDPLRDILFAEMSRTVALKEGGESIELPAIQAVVRSLLHSSIKGNHKAAQTVIQMMTAAEAARKADMTELFYNLESYKQRWEPIFERAAQLSHPEPTQLPHPRHVNIDPYTAELCFSGPLDREGKLLWDDLKARLRLMERSYNRYCREADEADDPNGAEAVRAREMAEFMKDAQARFERQVPPGWDWREELGFEAVHDAKLFPSKDN